ncbi:MAG: hypothetical protein ACTSXT_11195 [Candidatus Helarchaeota archaeon]
MSKKERFCRYCKKKIGLNDKVCPYCGKNLQYKKRTVKKVSTNSNIDMISQKENIEKPKTPSKTNTKKSAGKSTRKSTRKSTKSKKTTTSKKVIKDDLLPTSISKSKNSTISKFEKENLKKKKDETSLEILLLNEEDFTDEYEEFFF